MCAWNYFSSVCAIESFQQYEQKCSIMLFLGCTEDSEFPAWIIIVIILGALLLLGILVLIGIRIFMELRVSEVWYSNADYMFIFV